MNYEYETYNSMDPELNHVHVEIPYEHLNGGFGHMTRIAPHGVDRIITDGGWPTHDVGWRNAARFVYNWGSGPVVEILGGKVTKDTR